jgi:hypothetical protein
MALEQFQQKCIAVLRPKWRKDKKIERFGGFEEKLKCSGTKPRRMERKGAKKNALRSQGVRDRVNANQSR